MKNSHTAATPEALDTIRQQAAEWLLIVQAADVSPDDLLAWEAWLNENPLHRQAFDAVGELSGLVESCNQSLADIPLPDDGELAADGYDGSVPVASWPRTNDDISQQHKSRRSFVWLAAAATVLLAAGAGWLRLADNLSPPSPGKLGFYETVAAEHRAVDLADGSRIELGAASALSVNFSGSRRTVVLEQGEALFEVAKDKDRPFVVVAGSGTITAVGTAFNVRRDTDRVVVTVTEGIVEVAQARRRPATLPPDVPVAEDMSPAAETTLTAGERAAYDAGGLRRLDDVTPEAATGWREGRLRYRAEALKHVISDVDRYSDKQIILGDGVGELVFTGTVFQDEADDWLMGLEQVFPVEVVPMDGNRVLVRLTVKD